MGIDIVDQFYKVMLNLRSLRAILFLSFFTPLNNASIHLKYEYLQCRCITCINQGVIYKYEQELDWRWNELRTK